MVELLSINNFATESKISLLNGLGFSSDGIYVLYDDGEKVLDRYTKEPIRIDNMAILPGSTIILDNNPLSISSYFEEFGEVI